MTPPAKLSYEELEAKNIELTLQVNKLREALRYIYDNIDDEDSPSTSPYKWIKDSCEEALSEPTPKDVVGK